MEVFNEFTIMMTCHFLQCFCDNSLPLEFKGYMAFVLIFIAVFNMLVNIVLVVVGGIGSLLLELKAVYDEAVLYYIKRVKLNNQRIITESAKGKFPEIEHNLDELEALDEARGWRVRRKWLRANKVDVSTFPDEQKY